MDEALFPQGDGKMSERPPGLVFEMTYLVKVSNPLAPTSGSPHGAKQYWQVSDASLAGPRIRAGLAATGIDWMSVGADGFWRPDVRVQFMSDDGAIIFMHYTGLVEQTDRFKKAAEEDQSTAWDDQYMRLMLHFETGAERYRWLNQSLFVAKGRLQGTGRIEYAVYRLD
jgi:Protein of unknown function (DUF3237)